MWERINQSEVVVRRNILPARVVLDRDAEFGEYRTYLEFIPRDCHPTFLNGRILRDLECALEDFIAAKAKIVRHRVTRWALYTQRHCHLRPSGVSVALQLPEVYRGHRQRAVV